MREKSNFLLATFVSRMLVLVIAVVAYGPMLYASMDDPMPASLRAYLKELQLTEADMQAIVAGRPVALLMDTESSDEVAIFGIVRIHTSQQRFIDKLRNIVSFESGGGIRASNVFHTPPQQVDVSNLSLEEKDLRKIQECKPGNCALKLSSNQMKFLDSKINWNALEANSQAQVAIRQVVMDSISKYQKEGNDALSVYEDSENPYSVRVGLNQLLQHSSHMYLYDAELANYIAKYPADRPSNTEDIFYWQTVQFGLKPVVRASHLIIHRVQDGNSTNYRIASKMLSANHYFRSALELKTLISNPDDPDSFYLVCMNRAHVDGMTGIKGLFLRRVIKSRIRQSMAHYLDGVKKNVESPLLAEK